jgi:hypothetical protein
VFLLESWKQSGENKNLRAKKKKKIFSQQKDLCVAHYILIPTRKL